MQNKIYKVISYKGEKMYLVSKSIWCMALAQKTVLRASKSGQKFNKFGARNPIFLISAASVVSFYAALLLYTGSKEIAFTKYSYLMKPLVFVSFNLRGYF